MDGFADLIFSFHSLYLSSWITNHRVVRLLISPGATVEMALHVETRIHMVHNLVWFLRNYLIWLHGTTISLIEDDWYIILNVTWIYKTARRAYGYFTFYYDGKRLKSLKLHWLNLEVDPYISGVYLQSIYAVSRHGDRPHKFFKVFNDAWNLLGKRRPLARVEQHSLRLPDLV